MRRSAAATAAAAATLVRWTVLAERDAGRRRRDDRDAGAGRRRLVAGREANVDPVELVSGARFVGTQRRRRSLCNGNVNDVV